MLDKDRMIEARRLIRAGHFIQAKALLTGIDHPKAKEWLSLLPDASPGRGSSTGMKIMAAVAVLLIILVAGGGGFLIGRETMRQEIAAAFSGLFQSEPVDDAAYQATEAEIATVNAAIYPMLTQTFQAFMNTPTPVPAGGTIDGYYPVRVVRVDRPSRLEIVGSFSGTAYEPVEGTELVAIQIEVICPADQVTCYTNAMKPDLALADGRVVLALDSMAVVIRDAGDDGILGGKSLLVWRVYEIPEDADPAYLVIERNTGLLP